MLYPYVFAVAMLLYGLTASRTIGWQDSGQFVLRVVRGEATDPFGLCCAHPLHFWLSTLAAKILPLQPPAAVAMVSALFGAIAVANVFGIVRTLTNRVEAALLAAVGLAVAHTFWRFSTFVEVYSVTAAMLTAEMWALVMWDRTRQSKWLVLMFLANGLGWANHDLALLTLPVIGIVLLLALRTGEAPWKTLLFAAIVWVAGSSILLSMIAQETYATGSLVAAIKSALFGNFESQVMSRGPLLTYTATSIAFTLLSFPNLILPASLWGVIRGRRLAVSRISFWSLAAATAIHLAFVLRYAVIDQYTFLMPVYALVAVFAGIGFADVLERWTPFPRRLIIGLAVASLALTPTIYPLAASITRRLHLLGRFTRHKPYRDDYRYLFIPWGLGEDSAERMSHEALDLAGTSGLIVVEDEMARFAVQYQRERYGMSGVEVVPTFEGRQVIERIAAHRPVVLVPARVDLPPVSPPIGIWKPVGSLYVLDVLPVSNEP